jgi:hypothetical protein
MVDRGKRSYIQSPESRRKSGITVMSRPQMRDNQESTGGNSSTALHGGDRDFVAAVNSQFIAKQSAMVPKLQPAIMLAGCGHWTEQERAPEVSAAMIDLLRSL